MRDPGSCAPTVWVERGAITIETRADRHGRTAPERRFAPGADAALRYLEEAGCRVVMLEEGGRPPEGALGWLVTGEPARCAEARDRRGLETILIGPSRPGRAGAARVADLEVRGPLEAALAVLAGDAMPAGGDA